MPKKLDQQPKTVWIKQSIKSEDQERILSWNNGTEVLSWIEQKIGVYRWLKNEREMTPSRSELIRHIEKLIKNTESLMTDLEKIPVGADADILEICIERFNCTWHQKKQSINDINEILSEYLPVLHDTKSLTGEKPKDLEKNLFAEFVLIIEQKSNFERKKAIEVSSTILVNNGVPFLATTETPAEARKIINQYLKKIGLKQD